MTLMQIALVSSCVLGIAAGQLLFKHTADSLAGTTGVEWIRSLALSPTFGLALCIYGAMTLFWVWILRSAPLTSAYPLFALSFVFVPVLASLFFSEPLSPRTILGSVVIMVGIIIAIGSPV